MLHKTSDKNIAYLTTIGFFCLANSVALVEGAPAGVYAHETQTVTRCCAAKSITQCQMHVGVLLLDTAVHVQSKKCMRTALHEVTGQICCQAMIAGC